MCFYHLSVAHIQFIVDALFFCVSWSAVSSFATKLQQAFQYSAFVLCKSVCIYYLRKTCTQPTSIRAIYAAVTTNKYCILVSFTQQCTRNREYFAKFLLQFRWIVDDTAIENSENSRSRRTAFHVAELFGKIKQAMALNERTNDHTQNIWADRWNAMHPRW